MKVRMRVNGCPGTLAIERCKCGRDIVIKWYCDCGRNAYNSGGSPNILHDLGFIFGPEFGGSEAFPNCDCKENEIAWPQEKYDPRDLAILGGDPSL